MHKMVQDYDCSRVRFSVSSSSRLVLRDVPLDDALFIPAAASVAEPPNLMPPKSTRLLLDTKYSRDDTKLRSFVGHTPWEDPKTHIFPSGSQMRE